MINFKPPNYFRRFRAFELSSFRASLGFTLLEVIITLAILAIMGSIGFSYLSGFQKGAELEEVANQIVGKLRETQNKAMAGEDNSSWGIHFDNVDANNPYYIIFSGTSYPGTAVETIYLDSFASGAKFQTPTGGASVNIIFPKITGSPSSAQDIVVELLGATKTISVETSGRVHIQ